MVRLFNVYYPVRTLILLAGETLILCASFLAAGLIRFGSTSSGMFGQAGWYRIAIAGGVFLLCMYYYDLYDSFILTSPREIVTRLIQVLGTGCVIMAAIYYFAPQSRLELGLFLVALGLAALLLGLWRKLFLVLNASNRFAVRSVLFGSGPLAKTLASEIQQRSEWGVKLVGYLGAPADSNSLNGLPCLGGLESLADVLQRERVAQVIITLGERRGRLPVELLLDLKARGVRVQDGADVYEALTGKVALDSLRLSWLLFSPGFQVSYLRRTQKRIFSLLLSLAALILTAPLFVVIAIAVRLDSKGPIIYRQQRVGQGGRIFMLNKFRTMKAGADANGDFRPARPDDERFTRVGRWLRRTRLDELPQLYNILRGDMHFVGPRPFVPSQEQECAEKIPFYRQRWSVKPGATGWAQINRGYCATIEDNADKLAYDLYYIKHMSLGLDLLIIFRTLKTLILGRGGR